MIVYVGEGSMYKGCGRLGHTLKSCNHRLPPQTLSEEQPEYFGINKIQDEDDDWKIVTFPRRKKSTDPTNQGQDRGPKNTKQNNKMAQNSGKNVRCKFWEASRNKNL